MKTPTPDHYVFQSEETWYEDLVAEDPQAIQHLIDFCLPITHYYLGRQAVPDADQAAIDIAYIVISKLKTEKVSSLRGWIRRICRNTCFSLLRKEFPPVVGSDTETAVARLHFESLTDRHSQIPDTSFYPSENDLPENENRAALNLEDLSGLTDREKRIVALFLEGNRPAEIAEVMDISVNNVKSSWNQLLKKLRKLRSQ